MTKTATPDEQPKRKVAKRVITEKRKYFVPDCGISVEADSAADAVDVARKQVKTREEGDAQ